MYKRFCSCIFKDFMLTSSSLISNAFFGCILHFHFLVSLCPWPARIGKGKSQQGFQEAVFNIPFQLMHRLILMISTTGTVSVGSPERTKMHSWQQQSNSGIFKAYEVLIQNLLLKSEVQIKPFPKVRGAGLERQDKAFGIGEEAIH